MEAKVIFPIKTLNQLPLVLKGFRKERGLTQAAMAERLNISQQSYAYFEANPEKATLERLFTVLRMLDVEVTLKQLSPANSKRFAFSIKALSKRSSTAQAIDMKSIKKSSAKAISKTKPSAVVNAGRIVSIARKKESW
jgi:HTH-type transcriptional regulator/antitoxin HipB